MPMDESIHKKNFKSINIRDLFMDKNPSLARWIPGFVYRFLARILRIDFMNDLLTKVKNMDGIFVPINKYGAQAIENVRRIKTNLEMFFLPNESYKHRNKHFVITFGKPIFRETFDKRFTPLEWAQQVKDHVYCIAEDPEKEFNYIKN